MSDPAKDLELFRLSIVVALDEDGARAITIEAATPGGGEPDHYDVLAALGYATARETIAMQEDEAGQ